MGLMRKVEIKGVLVKLGNKMCMPFCCDDCIYFNILTCLVSRNLDQGAQYLSNSSN